MESVEYFPLSDKQDSVPLIINIKYMEKLNKEDLEEKAASKVEEVRRKAQEEKEKLERKAKEAGDKASANIEKEKEKAKKM